MQYDIMHLITSVLQSVLCKGHKNIHWISILTLIQLCNKHERITVRRKIKSRMSLDSFTVHFILLLGNASHVNFEQH